MGACFTTISYLSGARPGEVLSLRRGCIEHDSAARIYLMHGRKWKGARDGNGAKIPEGQERKHPWVVAEPVARAVEVLERLHDSDLLFPAVVLRKSPSGKDRARCVGEISETIVELIDWVNAYCGSTARRDRIPDDPAGPIAPSRYRRTLAWFICRRPRGIVACALQYGHLHVLQSLGYSGTYASGFPDELAMEEWLARLDHVQDAERRLDAGEHISGTAADAYRSRVTGATAKFAGRVIRSGRQAKAVLANPALQIYSGEGMTCVFDPAKHCARCASPTPTTTGAPPTSTTVGQGAATSPAPTATSTQSDNVLRNCASWSRTRSAHQSAVTASDDTSTISSRSSASTGPSRPTTRTGGSDRHDARPEPG